MYFCAFRERIRTTIIVVVVGIQIILETEMRGHRGDARERTESEAQNTDLPGLCLNLTRCQDIHRFTEQYQINRSE